MACLNHLVPKSAEAVEVNGASNGSASLWYGAKEVSTESLVIGALESAFWEMDQSIGEDKKRYKMLGGCTVIISLFILGGNFLHFFSNGSFYRIYSITGRPLLTAAL